MLFSFWSGPVTWVERLSVASAHEVGADITVFTYGDRKALSAALGCPVADAASIFKDRGMNDVLRRSVPHFSDYFRLEGIAKGYGTWVDLDVIFVRPPPNSEYLFGWQGRDRIGNSVLRLPPESELLQRYLAFCRERPVRCLMVPWLSWRKRCTRLFKSTATAMAGGPGPLPKYGPPALTYFTKLCGVDHLALPPSALYPLPIKAQDIARACEPGFLDALMTRETICVHLWRTTFRGIHGPDDPKTGWLAERVERLLPPRLPKAPHRSEAAANF